MTGPVEIIVKADIQRKELGEVLAKNDMAKLEREARYLAALWLQVADLADKQKKK
jgi:hypothetical protein